jgi:PhnB protein
LSVRGGAAAVEFYKTAFVLEKRFRIDDEQGVVVATLGVDDLAFWVTDESLENLNPSPVTVGGSTARMILYVEEPFASFERAVRPGAVRNHQ